MNWLPVRDKSQKTHLLYGTTHVHGGRWPEDPSLPRNQSRTPSITSTHQRTGLGMKAMRKLRARARRRMQAVQQSTPPTPQPHAVTRRSRNKCRHRQITSAVITKLVRKFTRRLRHKA